MRTFVVNAYTANSTQLAFDSSVFHVNSSLSGTVTRTYRAVQTLKLVNETDTTGCYSDSPLLLSPNAFSERHWPPAIHRVRAHTGGLHRRRLRGEQRLAAGLHSDRTYAYRPFNASSFAYLDRSAFYTLSALYEYSRVARYAAGDCTSGPLNVSLAAGLPDSTVQ